jgi:hypothetical protein
MVEYIAKTPPKINLINVCNEFKIITRAYSVDEFAPYSVVLLTTLALVVVDVSVIGFDMC